MPTPLRLQHIHPIRDLGQRRCRCPASGRVVNMPNRPLWSVTMPRLILVAVPRQPLRLVEIPKEDQPGSLVDTTAVATPAGIHRIQRFLQRSRPC